MTPYQQQLDALDQRITAIRKEINTAPISELAKLTEQLSQLMEQRGQVVARGDGAVAIGEKGINVGGNVGGNIISGDQTTADQVINFGQGGNVIVISPSSDSPATYEQMIAQALAQGKSMQEIVHMSQELTSAEQNIGKYKWQSHFPEIDFQEASRIFSQVNQQFGFGGGAAAFFLQKSRALGGVWCVQKLKKMLKTGDFKHFEIEFAPPATLSADKLLAQLAGHINFEMPAESESRSTNQIVHDLLHKLYHSVQSGSVVLLELRIWNSTGFHDQFLPWFLNHFWKYIISNLPELAQQHPKVRFIALLIVNGSLMIDTLPADFCCTIDNFKSDKLLELPLRRWSQDEIANWLFDFGRLTGEPVGWKPTEIMQEAQRIYLDSDNGQPALVYAELSQTLGQYYH